jgi:hypothetical protein
MSTASEIERIPATVRRCFSHAGVGAAGSVPRTATAVNRSQPIGSSTTIG